MTPPVVIYGAGPFAELMTRHLEAAGRRVLAFTVDREHLPAGEALRPVVPFEELAARHPPGEVELFVAIGYRRMRARRPMLERALARGYALASYVSPTAVVARDAVVGRNVALLDQVLVEPGASVGDHVVCWSGVIVGHGVRIEDDAFLGARALLAGRSVVGRGSFLGLGAATINDVRLAPETHLLPGSYAYQDTEPMTRYLGVPARAVGRHVERGIEIERG